MNQEELRNAAVALEQQLGRYAGSSDEARTLSGALQPLLEKVLAGQLRAPVRWEDVPGWYSFLEGNLRQYADLENAYNAFRIQATGGYTPEMREALATVARIRAQGSDPTTKQD